MLALTSLGLVHTAISLVAVGAGIFLLFRQGRITSRSSAGKLYLWTTVITAITGFPIMQHGGFGKPHAVGVLTLITLAVAEWAARGKLGRISRYVEVVGYSATFLFHMIPAVVETTTRLPVGNPWIKDRDGAELQAAAGVLVILFLAGAALQVRRLSKEQTIGASIGSGLAPTPLRDDPKPPFTITEPSESGG